ncbi:MAG: hypothetical protein D6814_08790 [Calditrichaeota bacterium]|nr:MAG: hypothetical protein D6814_08790 [Calditrichota bacterium]
MALIMKVRCNGPAHHVNEIDLEKVLQEVVAYRGVEETNLPPLDQLPPRIVLPCQKGSEGKVVIKREMIKDFLQRSSKKSGGRDGK